MSTVIKTLEELNKAFDANERIFIDIYSESNEDSRNMKPYFEAVASDDKNKGVKFLRVNVDEPELQQVRERYDIKQVPTFLALQSRELAAQYQGNDHTQLQRTIDQLCTDECCC
ncbi:hypothetical protein B0O80DRAFT_459784 [Mortierella sp. GBAus27b]|nr:hypothetical protein BGX31_008303 [Mortierella sp. GBA43]KAI8349547.1 hypothetical protein B0O80DRAFT_459784 [Mortierella sp. GBAus27b]